jgi:hypothetical protein
MLPPYVLLLWVWYHFTCLCTHQWTSHWHPDKTTIEGEAREVCEGYGTGLKLSTLSEWVGMLKTMMFPFALLHYDMCLHNSHIPFSRHKLSHTLVLDFVRLRYDLRYRITYILYTNYVPSNFSLRLDTDIYKVLAFVRLSNFSLRLDTDIYKVLAFVRLSNFSLRYFLECDNRLCPLPTFLYDRRASNVHPPTSMLCHHPI